MDNPETPKTVDVENAGEDDLESGGFSEVRFIELAGTPENGKMVNVCNKDESENSDEKDIKFEKEIDSTMGRCFTSCVDEGVDELKCVKHIELEKGCLTDGGDLGRKNESEIGTEKIVVKKHDGVGLEGDVFAMKIDVSGDGLSLTVDFSNLKDDVLGSGKISSENMSKEGVEMMDVVDNGTRNYNFSEDDIVWVKTKNQKWWPGKVARHSALDIPATVDENGSLLVQYFGSSNVTECFPSQLKHFDEDFKILSENNKSRRFIGAVEKATNEFGRRIRSEMTCSCDEDGIKNEIDSSPSHKSSVLGKFSISHFEPASFLAHLRSIAQGSSVSEDLELIIMKYRLSAIYCSMGYRQLPLYQLYDTSDECDSSLETSLISAEEKEEIKSKSRKRNRINDVDELEFSELDSTFREKKEQISEPRERKRSKYLSYPYINFSQISIPAETGEISAWKDHHESLQETIDDDNSVASPDFVANRSGKFWSNWYKRFSTGSDFCDNSESINMSSADFLSELRLIALNCLHPSKNKSFASVGWFLSRFRISQFHDEWTYNGENKDTESEDKKRKRRGSLKKEGRTMSLSGLSEVNIDIAPCSSMIKDSLEIGHHHASSKPKNKKKKEVASSGNELSKSRTSIPDLNGGHGRPERKKRLKLDGSSEHSIVTSELLDVNERSREGLFVIDLQGTPTDFSRKHEEQSTISASGVPDLNGTDIEHGNASQSVGEKEKREFESQERHYMNTDGGLVAILLTFSADAPTPSKEELISTFGQFGTLRESEIKFNDSSNALVIFEKDGDAVEAFRSLEMNKPFGAAIFKSKLCNYSPASGFCDSFSSKSSP